MPDSLILDPICLRYGGDEPLGVEDLQRQLAVHNTVQPIVINRQEDVLMGLDGTVQHRYRYTARGLSMLCRRLAGGLSPLISELAGIKESDATTDLQLAVRIINGVIRIRFGDKLIGCRFIVDPARSAIEGVVSPRYEYLSNHDWLESCQLFMHQTDGSRPRFLSASMVGRRLLVRYVDDRPWLAVNADGIEDYYRRGWSFTNSETGESSVRAGMLIVDEADNASFKLMGRKTHTKSLRTSKGKDLLGKLGDVYEKVNAGLLRRNITQLHSRPLPQAESDADLQALADHITSQLTRRLPKNIANSVAGSALSPVGCRAQQVSAESFRSRLTFSPVHHSYYHLYSALTSHARECFPREQENTEALAYELLRGKFQLLD